MICQHPVFRGKSTSMFHSIFAVYSLVVLSLLVQISSSSVFRFGAVLSTEGERKELLEVKNGYQLFFDQANSVNNGRGFYLRGKANTTGFYFKYAFLWKEDYSDHRQHGDQLETLIKQEKVHFIGGSHTDFANQEMEITNASSILNFQCCVGQDEFYEQNLPYVFGIHVSNKEYTRFAIQRLTFEDLKNIQILADEGNAFTKSTCNAAMEYARPLFRGSSIVMENVYQGFSSVSKGPTFFKDFANRAKRLGVEAVFACVFQRDARLLVDAFHDIQYPLKAFFITVAPAVQEWVDTLRPPFIADNLLSAAQWHKEMKYSDDFFGTGLQYVEAYEKKFVAGQPSYISASASAVGLTLHKAIQEAFSQCDITTTDGIVDQLLFNQSSIKCDDDIFQHMNGYDRIVKALTNIDIEIFFGRVKFNKFRRNVGLKPVTTQVFRVGEQKDESARREIKAVLPLSHATTLLRFPAENYYIKSCLPGFYVGPDPYDRCKECPRGMISFQEDSYHCDSCPLGKYMHRIGQSSCLDCPKGSTTLDRGAITKSNCTCLPDYYEPSGLNGSECFPCPVGATCQGTTTRPYPLKGYWMNETERTYAYACDSENNCLGGPDSACESGTTGRLCSGCAHGYFSIINKCYKCLPDFSIILLYILLLIGWYIVNVTVSRNVASLEMLLGWAQLANIIGDIDLNWTPMLTRMFGVANILDFDVDILQPTCLISSWGFMQNFIVQLSLPFVMSLMAGVGFLSSLAFYYLQKKNNIKISEKRKKMLSWFVHIPNSAEDLEKKCDTTIATFLASVEITYVTITKYCFDVFKCEDIAGVLVMRSSADVECNTQTHRVLIVLSTFGILFYVIGYSVYSSWILFHLKKDKSFLLEKNLRRFGFIYGKFELDYYYTPIIIIFRKLLFVMVLVYFNDPSFQLGAIAIIINASLMIHVYTAPYVDTYIDILFSFLLLALMFEAFGGLMFHNDDLPQQNRNILEWIVMGTLFVLILVFLVIFIMEITNKYYMHCIKRMHMEFNFRNLGLTGNSLHSSSASASASSLRKSRFLQRAASIAASVTRKAEVEHLFELMDTFKPAFVYQCMKKDPSFIQDWDKLSQLLKDYVSDQSPTSYLSVEPGAKFWRKIVDRFPEIVDLLLVINTDTRDKFKEFADCLYKDFYLTNKIVSLPLMQILNWRDRAPLAHWLSTALDEDREFFSRTLSKMYSLVGHRDISKMLEEQKAHGGSIPTLKETVRTKAMSQKQKQTLDRIIANQSPMEHPALEQVKTAANVALCASKFKKKHAERKQLNAIELSPSFDGETPAGASTNEHLGHVSQTENVKLLTSTSRNNESSQSHRSSHTKLSESLNLDLSINKSVSSKNDVCNE